MPRAIGSSPKMVPATRQSQGALDAVEQFDDLHLAGENREQRTLLPSLVRGVFPGTEVQVGGRPREALELGLRERREQRNGPDVVDCQHGLVIGRKREQATNQGLHTYPGPAQKVCAN
ncbi:MAG: hypothetical protein ACREUQ_04440 [Burkholderiales bacterium]